MQDIGSLFIKLIGLTNATQGSRLALLSQVAKVGFVLSALLLMSTGCGIKRSNEAARALQISQSWELQPGEKVAGHLITGGLGDVSIELKGSSVRAPFDGRVQPNTDRCVVYSSPEVPAYLFRLCDLKRPKLGEVREGEVIGSANHLQFAALRRQPDGKWALVEPSASILERTLQQP